MTVARARRRTEAPQRPLATKRYLPSSLCSLCKLVPYALHVPSFRRHLGGLGLLADCGAVIERLRPLATGARLDP
jgi:hypothetical protein